MHRMFTCFVQFHFTDVEVFASSGFAENTHVIYFNAKLIVCFSLGKMLIVYLVLDTRWFAMLVSFFSSLISGNISLLSRNKALNLERQYFEAFVC